LQLNFRKSKHYTHRNKFLSPKAAKAKVLTGSALAIKSEDINHININAAVGFTLSKNFDYCLFLPAPPVNNVNLVSLVSLIAKSKIVVGAKNISQANNLGKTELFKSRGSIES